MVEEAIREAIQSIMPSWGFPVWHQAASIVSTVQRYPLTSLAAGVGGFLGLGAWLCAHPKPTSDVFGHATFATMPEVQKASLLEPTGKVIGVYQGKTLYAPWESNVLVLGPPGYGKTAGAVLWTIGEWAGDLLVLALKASLVTRTKAIRAAKGPVYIFEPTAPSTTDRFNLFRGIPFGTRGEIAGCQELAQHLSEPPASIASGEGAHYDRVTTHILAAVALYVGLTQPDPSVPAMLKFMSAPGTVVELLQRMDQVGHPTLSEMVSRLRKEDARRMATDWLAGIEWLTVWDDPDLAYAMAGDTIPWTELQESAKPMTIYLRISAMDAKGRLQGVVRTILFAIMAHLMKRDPTQRRRPFLVLLDDAAELERMVIVQSIAAFGREYGITLMIVFQSPMQVWSSYGKLSSLFNTCQTKVIYAQNDPDSAEYLTKHLGTYTAEIPMETIQTGARMGRRRSKSTRLVERPLLLPQELSGLGDEEVLICHRKSKVRAQWRNAYADARFAGTGATSSP